MQTLPRLRSLDDWRNAYPISFEDYQDSLAHQRNFIGVLSNAIRQADDPRKIAYLNNMQAIEQATHYALVRYQ